jgi:hypothetical protein
MLWHDQVQTFNDTSGVTSMMVLEYRIFTHCRAILVLQWFSLMFVIFPSPIIYLTMLFVHQKGAHWLLYVENSLLNPI